MSPSSQTAAPRRRGRPTEPLEQRIPRLADRTGDCWLWTGYLDQDGYGRITVRKRTTLAHRASYETFTGPIPDGMEIDHLCRIRHCVKPEHLEAVPHRENVIRSMNATGKIGSRKVGADDANCINGHPWTEDNTYWSSGRRSCKPCRRIRNRQDKTDARPGRLYVDHGKIAASLKVSPQIWSLVATYDSRDAATHVAYYIRSGKRLTAYQPAGSFEGEFRTVDGEFQVHGRYVGAVAS